MRIVSPLRSWFGSIFRRTAVETEMDAELRSHIEARTEDLVRGGVARDEALRRARIEFGGVENFKEECREARGANLLESLLQDIRFGFRMLRKSPGFTAVAVLTLALGIGANTAIFSVVYDVLLRPLPYSHPEQLVSVLEAKPQQGIKIAGVSFLDFDEWQRQNHVFSALAGGQRHQLTLTGRGDPSVVDTIVVTPEMLSLLAAQPILGRTFFPEDGKKGAAPVVIVSENLWRSQLAANPNILGSSITLDQRPYTVIGVMPAGFHVPLFTGSQQIWIPLAQDPLFGGWMERRGGHWLGVIGRLKPGVSIAQAQAEMDTIAAQLAKEFPAENSGWIARVRPFQQVLVGNVKSALFVLLGAVGLVLLIACANIANLLLARATSRAREMALRQALGAARGRVLQQLLTESALLGSLGAIAGIFLAFWGVRALRSVLPPDLPHFGEIRVDGWVLVFALVISAVASLVFGLAPALLAADSRVQANLKEGARSGEGVAHGRARKFLAAAEMALAVVLVVAAGLLLRSFASLTSVNPGFNVENLVKAEVSLPQYQYSTSQQWNAFASSLLERVQAQPGMQNSAIAVPVPLADGNVNLGFSIAGNPPLPPGIPASADYVSVTPEYFRVMGIPLLRGRLFAREDSPSAPHVALINEAFAKLYFPNRDPIGQHLVFGFPPNSDISREIVGIVGDVRDVALHQEPGPMMYVPFVQAPFWGAVVVVKSNLSVSSVVGSIRQSVSSIDKNLPVTDVASMTQVLDSSVAQPRFRTWLLGLFGLVALLLATVGIFGVISYSVSCRTHEFGVRVALGASPGDVRNMVLRESFQIASAGLAVGIAAALALTGFLRTQLYGVGGKDPLTFVGAAVLLMLAALVAGYLPARRATRVDPLVALRYE